MSGPVASSGRARPLGTRERALLDFERDWSLHQGGKAAAIRERFGISPARYYQLIARLVDLPAARHYDPLVVARLRRRRERRAKHGRQGLGSRRGR